MTYSIWLVPDSKDAKYLNKIIQKLAKEHNAPKFSAHITLYSGIKSLSKAKSAIQLLDARKIKATKTGIGQSDYVWKTLYIKIKKDKTLAKTHKTLHKTLGTKYDFAPHISLIYKKMDCSTKRKIKSHLEIKKSFTFCGVIIIRSSTDVSKWKVLYHKRLGLGAA